MKTEFLKNTDLFTLTNLAQLDDLMFERTSNTITTQPVFTNYATSVYHASIANDTPPSCSNTSTILLGDTLKITSGTTSVLNNHTENNETITLIDASSNEESENEQQLTNKEIIENYIFYQNGSIQLTLKDIKTCKNKSLLKDNCIEAFMKSFNNNKVLVLSYHDANKLAILSNLEDKNLSIKVISFKCTLKSLFYDQPSLFNH